MPRPQSRPDTDPDGTSANAPDDTMRDAGRSVAPLSNGMMLLAIGTLVFGSCGGLSAGCEGLASFADNPKVHSRTNSAQDKQVQAELVKLAKEPLNKARGGTALLYALACLLAVGLAGAVLAKAGGLAPRGLLAYSAAALAVLRLGLTGLDVALIERSMEVIHDVMQKTPGYSYQQTAGAMGLAEDIGSTTVAIFGVGMALYWIITAFAYWGADDS